MSDTNVRRWWITEAFIGANGTRYPAHVTTCAPRPPWSPSVIEVVPSADYEKLERENGKKDRAIKIAIDAMKEDCFCEYREDSQVILLVSKCWLCNAYDEIQLALAASSGEGEL